MARVMTQTLHASAARTLTAAVAAADSLGLEHSAAERDTGELRIRSRTGRGRPVFLAVTDNGRGGATLHLTWDDAFPGRIAGRRVARALCREMRRLLG